MGDSATVWRVAQASEIQDLLKAKHYLGPLKSGGRHILAGEVAGEVVAAQVWRTPTSRHLPQDGTWLELSRWCLTPEAGLYAGSRMHGWVARWLREHAPQVTTLVSYSDPAAGHTGALYRSANWLWSPTWLRLRPPPTANGNWGGKGVQSVKDRWVFVVRRDKSQAEALRVKDNAALKAYVAQHGLARLAPWVAHEWREITRAGC